MCFQYLRNPILKYWASTEYPSIIGEKFERDNQRERERGERERERDRERSVIEKNGCGEGKGKKTTTRL